MVFKHFSEMHLRYRKRNQAANRTEQENCQPTNDNKNLFLFYIRINTRAVAQYNPFYILFDLH